MNYLFDTNAILYELKGLSTSMSIERQTVYTALLLVKLSFYLMPSYQKKKWPLYINFYHCYKYFM